MTLRIAVQMDPPARLNAKADSTIMLMQEAQKRGHQLWYYHPSSLVAKDGSIFAAKAQPITLKESADWYELGDAKSLDLADVDAVLMRQDPPYDMTYLSATYLLDRLEGKTLVVNNPSFVRSHPEKLSILQFAEFIPPTIVTRDEDEILAFRKAHGTIVAKPLYGFGGRSIFKFEPDDSNLLTLLEQWFEASDEPVMIQAFLPEVKNQDMRVIVMNGEGKGGAGRIPAQGEIRANFRVGGTAAEAILNERQQQICQTVGAWLKEGGVFFAGLDLIGDYLTEINITSPTGLRAVEQLYGTNPATDFWDALEEKLNA